MDDSMRQDFVPFAQNEAYRDRAGFAIKHNEWIEQWRRAYWLAHRLTGSQVKCHYGDVYSLKPELSIFDVVIVGSVLEHLADPVKALASVARHAGQHMIIVTPMIDTDEPIARFEPRLDAPEVDYVFWTYSREVLRRVLGMLGFNIERIKKRKFKAEWDGGRRHVRFVITASRR
jgi:hypothetical protein